MGHVPPKISLKDLEDFATIQEFRENPVIAAQLLLNRDYDPQQAMAVNGVWKHPYSMLDWGRGLGKCILGMSEISLVDGTVKTIAELYETKISTIKLDENESLAVFEFPLKIKSMNKNKIVDAEAITILKQKVNEDLYKITLKNGKNITCTAVHRFYSADKHWVKAEDLAFGDYLSHYTPAGGIRTSRIEDIQLISAGIHEYVYDLVVPGYENYIANGIISHNTTVSTDILVLSGLLYPGTISMAVSHSMKGTKTIFNELIKTWSRSEIVKRSTIKKPTKGNDMCEMIFDSVNPVTGQQTIINGIAADVNNEGSTIRGQRVSRCLYIDEWILLPRDLIEGAILPTASTSDDPFRPEYDLGLKRIMFTSSSGYTYMEAYERMETFRKFYLYPEKYPEFALDKNGKPMYFYHNCNYTKFTKAGIIDQDAVKSWRATFSIPKFNTEVLAKWESQSDSWYNAKTIKGDPEKNDPGMWIDSSVEEDARWVDNDKSGKYAYVLSMDYAERKDEAGMSLLRVTPNKIYIVDTDGYKHKPQESAAEILRGFFDKFDIHSLVMDPEGGGRGVGAYLKNLKMRMNTLTNKHEPFFPIYPVQDKWLNKGGEIIPAGARRILEYVTFSNTAAEANLTDLNITLRALIEGKNLLVDENAPKEFKEKVETLFNQIISIEAEPIAAKNSKNGKQAADKGRYSFTSRILKDRWAALLIGVHQALILQAQLNYKEEDEDPGIVIIEGGLFGQGEWY